MFYGITEYSYCNLVFICVLNTVVRQDTILFIIKNLEDIFYETELIICIYKMPHIGDIHKDNSSLRNLFYFGDLFLFKKSKNTLWAISFNTYFVYFLF